MVEFTYIINAFNPDNQIISIIFQTCPEFIAQPNVFYTDLIGPFFSCLDFFFSVLSCFRFSFINKFFSFSGENFRKRFNFLIESCNICHTFFFWSNISYSIIDLESHPHKRRNKPLQLFWYINLYTIVFALIWFYNRCCSCKRNIKYESVLIHLSNGYWFQHF